MNTLQARPNQWTVADLAALDDAALDQVAHRAVGHLTIGKLILGRCILAADHSGLAERRGCSGATHYAILKGIELYEARDCRRVARKLEDTPRLRELAENGQIGWAYLREVTRVASAETEDEWIRLCRKYSSRLIQKLVKRTDDGQHPLDPQSEPASEWPTETELRVMLPSELTQMLAWISRELSTRGRRRMPMARVLECLVAEHLAGSCFPEEKVWVRLQERARRDLAAEHAQVEQIVEKEKNARCAEAPWEAVAVEEGPCPSDPTLQLARSSPPHWENAKLRFNPEARHPTEAQRAEVVRRDAYACSTPGCPNHLWLAVHHIVFYCEGGVTLPANLIAVCSACHCHIHDGLLQVAGEAPNGLRWSDSAGSGLLDQRPDGWFGWDLEGG